MKDDATCIIFLEIPSRLSPVEIDVSDTSRAKSAMLLDSSGYGMQDGENQKLGPVGPYLDSGTS